MSSSTEPANENIEPVVESVPAAATEAPPPDAQAERIRILEEENAKLRDQFVRAVAETDNVRKRSQRDLEENAKYAITSFARELVAVLESLQRASESIPALARTSNELLGTLGEGVDLTLQELLTAFRKHGIARLDPLKEKFDHNFHQAVVQIPRDDVPPGTVVQVLQSGYTIHDRLLRPAMVAVSKPGDGTGPVDTTA